jgi:DNA processing protein
MSFFDPEPAIAKEKSQSSISPQDELTHVEWLNGLLALEGIGNTKAILLAKNFRTYSQIMSATETEIQSVIGRNRIDFKQLKNTPLEASDNVQIVGYFDDNYPPGLRDLSDAPPILWARGKIPNNKALSIVGTRNADSWGRDITERFAKLAGDNGFTIVSGLALGIDTAAHMGCLQSKSPTVAILACDVRFPTPKSNIELAEKIIESGGCLISEVPFGTQTESHNLVARNRLQAAWSQGLIVTQCGIPSGTLHTVRFAMELQRKVVVLRPPANAEGDQYDGIRNLTEEFKFDSRILGGSKKFQTTVSSRMQGADLAIGSISEFEEYLRNA